MKVNFVSIVKRTLLFQACTLSYSHIVFAQSGGFFSNSSRAIIPIADNLIASDTPSGSISSTPSDTPSGSINSPPGDTPTATPSNPGFQTPILTTCGVPSCTVRIDPKTLRYPFFVNTVVSEITAFVIPVVYIDADGSRTTVYSTVQDGPTGTAYSEPTQSTLTWVTLGATLTHPTSYVGYPYPDVILSTLVSATTGNYTSTCDTFNTVIPYPAEQTPLLIFPITDKADPTPGGQIAFSYLDSLPTLTSLLNGGDPRSCEHTTPPQAAESSNPGFEPVIFTSISVVTKIGNPVTAVAPPFQDPPPFIPTNGGGEPQNNPTPTGGTGNGGGPNNGGQNNGGTGDTGGGNGGNGGTGGTGEGAGGAGGGTGAVPNPVTIDGTVITPAPNNGGGIVVDGQTIAPGNAGTLGNGAPISVPIGGGVVVVGNPITSNGVVVFGGSSSTIAIPQGAVPSPVTIGGTVITPLPNGFGVIVNGQTIGPGSSGTLANGVPFSVPMSGNVVILGSITTSAGVVITRSSSSTLTISRTSSTSSSRTSASSSSSTGVGSKMTIVGFEGTLVAVLLTFLGLL